MAKIWHVSPSIWRQELPLEWLELYSGPFHVRDKVRDCRQRRTGNFCGCSYSNRDASSFSGYYIFSTVPRYFHSFVKLAAVYAPKYTIFGEKSVMIHSTGLGNLSPTGLFKISKIRSKIFLCVHFGKKNGPPIQRNANWGDSRYQRHAFCLMTPYCFEYTIHIELSTWHAYLLVFYQNNGHSILIYHYFDHSVWGLFLISEPTYLRWTTLHCVLT